MKKLLFCLLLAISAPCFASEQRKEKEDGFFLVSRTDSQRGNYKIVSVSYFPSKKLCYEALMILQEETAASQSHRPDAECKPVPAPSKKK